MTTDLPSTREMAERLRPLRGGGPSGRGGGGAAVRHRGVERARGARRRCRGSPGLRPRAARGASSPHGRRARRPRRRRARTSPARSSPRASRAWMPRLEAPAIRAAIDLAARARVRLIVPGDPEWPTAVDDLGDHAPLCLWVRGDPQALIEARSSVALVGARAATGYGEHVAMEFGAELAGRGVTVDLGRRLRHRRDGAPRRPRGRRPDARAARGRSRPRLPGRAREPPRAHRLRRCRRQRGSVRRRADEVAVPQPQPADRRARPGDRGDRGGVEERVAQHRGARGDSRTPTRGGARVRSPRPLPPAATGCCASSTRAA